MTLQYLIGWAEGIIGGVALCTLLPTLIRLLKAIKADWDKG